MQETQMPHITVRMFGEFTVMIDGKVVSEPLRHAKKLRGVLQYLLLHADRPVSHTELYDTFWPEERSANPRGALKTLIHRLRAALEEGGADRDIPFFVVQQGSYQWNPALHAQIDAVEFEEGCRRLSDSTLTQQERTELLLRLSELYNGRFLDGSELWMATPAAYLHECYRKVTSELCDYYQREDMTEQTIALCRNALRFDELDEELNYALILALTDAGRSQDALAQYQHVTELYYSELGVQVSDELRALYRRIAEAEQSMDLDIDNVRGVLEEKDSTPGAYVCEYGIFQDIFRIEERCLARYGGRIFLGLLTVTGAKCEAPTPEVLSKAMDRLLAAACKSLRRSDVIARYSQAQFVVLLSTVTYETGSMVLERIQKLFRRENPRIPVSISCKLRPLRPAPEEIA